MYVATGTYRRPEGPRPGLEPGVPFDDRWRSACGITVSSLALRVGRDVVIEDGQAAGAGDQGAIADDVDVEMKVWAHGVLPG